MRFWQTSRRRILLDRPLVMGILNVTPDSFSDGGHHLTIDQVLARAEKMIAEGADIVDIGGESTRPGSSRVDPAEEIERTAPVIEAIAKRFDTPISIDTTKARVARRAIGHGAEIINDISGLRWEPELASLAASSGAGLILMHSRGDFGSMHSQPPVEEIVDEVTRGLNGSIHEARRHGVADGHIVLDVGIGFGKDPSQNLELIAKLDTIVCAFGTFPILVGASRKSFLGKLLGGVPPDERLGGSIAAAVLAIQNGARVIRAHDVKETVAAVKVASAIIGEK